jgi:hypothetical protein
LKIEFIAAEPDAEIKKLLSWLDVPLQSLLADLGRRAWVYKIYLDNILIGLEVCRIDVNYWGDRELVILHIVKSPDYSGEKFHEVIEAGEIEMCKVLNCPIVRRHIDRAGMYRVLLKYNYWIDEIVLKRKVGKCQLVTPLKAAQLAKILLKQ